MPDWLCPVCKTELSGNVKDGEYCKFCGYERVGSKELEKQLKTK